MPIKNSIVKTKYGSFQCSFEPEKDLGGYVVEAKGVSGAFSQGKNLSEAKKMIKEAIEGAIEAGILAKAEEAGTIRFAKNKSISLA